MEERNFVRKRLITHKYNAVMTGHDNPIFTHVLISGHPVNSKSVTSYSDQQTKPLAVASAAMLQFMHYSGSQGSHAQHTFTVGTASQIFSYVILHACDGSFQDMLLQL